MRKTTSIASKNLPLFCGITHLCSTQKLYHSISFQNLHLHQHLYGENVTHQRLIDLLQEPTRVQSVNAIKAFHAITITMGPNPTEPIVLYNTIISKYASLGEVVTARKLFDKMPQRNVVSYNTMIKAYNRNGILEEAWKLFRELRILGLKPTQFTFGGILSSALMNLVQGFQLLALIVKSGFLHADAIVGTALLGVFGSHGCLDEVTRVLEDMTIKNLVTWNCMISLFGQHGFVTESTEMFLELLISGVELSQSTFVGVLAGFTGEFDLELGEQIHGLVVKYGFEDSVSVANSLINMYAKCGEMCSAEKMFEENGVKDVVSWNTIIGAMTKSDRPDKAFSTFLQMCGNGTFPNQTTFVSVLHSCLCLKDPSYGKCIHAKIIKRNLESDVYVGSALIDFYAKHDKLEIALLCFDKISHKNLVCWNSLMAAYSNRNSSVALLLLREMFHCSYRPNEFSFSSVVKSSVGLEVQQLHSFIIKMGYHDNEYVSSSLISSYAKNGFIDDALKFVDAKCTPISVVTSNVIAGIYNRTRQYEKTQELYSALEEPDIVSWNILIAACSRNGDYREAFDLFDHMQRAKIRPDNYTYASLFSICSKLCNLALGRSLHGLVFKTDIKCCDTFVCNVMIDMYGKCGSLGCSFKIFNEMTNRNVITWTAIISALGLHGHAHEALEKFKEMEAEGFMPDKVALIAVISACRHVGLVKEGLELFEKMKPEYGVEPEMDHYLLAVDLLARYGNLREAEELIAGMPFPPNALVWRSFLEGCKRKRTTHNVALLM
ncbi:pentatricopeptide repeat-containing protein At3g58590 [Coffea eugenioides]|uniref:pentatricopeptide repeat-containing protein At3g58590 n=1 Tax=Coffea eugenioides TaxID=49369 RepID=UPI000F60FFD5|nr:pentatricopeptide repeat-containing protein At3g58590 [Coffea eugenioides]